VCGIVAICSDRDVSRESIRRLAVLEYRGYDSYGLAAILNGGITIHKRVGAIGDAISSDSPPLIPAATTIIGHTRWATHGGVSLENCHPHISYDGSIGIVHNGIIANYSSLRLALEGVGIPFSSETDSEVIAHMIARCVDEGMPMLDAISHMMSEVIGEYALGIISTTDPDVVYGVRNMSPLVLYNNSFQGILASDQLAFEDSSGGCITLLEDGDIVRVSPHATEVFAADPRGDLLRVDRKSYPYIDTSDRVSKGNYRHFMIKEINEAPTVAVRIAGLAGEEFTKILPHVTDRPILLFGAGSGYYVAQIGQYLLAQLGGVSAIALPSDEAESFSILRPGDYAIAISQSGETFDTIEMCRTALRKSVTVTAITNVANSTLERIAHHRLHQYCGPEISVLSTKSLVSQVVLLTRFGLELGRHLGTLPDSEYRSHLRSLSSLPQILQDCISFASGPLQRLAMRYKSIRHWFFVGRGILYPVAMESALKFKEGTYRQAEGIAAGSFKHGPISLIQRGFHTIVLLPSDVSSNRYTSTLATVSEIAARGGRVTGWGPSNSPEGRAADFADYVALPCAGNDITDAVTHLVVGQLWAYYYALNLGCDIDKPRHLAKSVTVR
jgi:glucosamine--fructose-6-phosphate aminotransferase (isomerizing)